MYENNVYKYNFTNFVPKSIYLRCVCGGGGLRDHTSTQLCLVFSHCCNQTDYGHTGQNM